MDTKIELHKRIVRYPSGVKTVYWTLRWRGTDGKRYSESIGKVGEMTKAEAETKRREKEIAIGSGRMKRNRPRAMTLAELFEHDAETVRGTVTLNTIESMKHAAAHARKAWGERTRISVIGPAHVARLKKYVLDEAKLSETTLAKTLRTLKAIFNRALKEGLLHENPFAGVRMPKTPSRTKRVFSADETRAMRSVVKNAWWKAFIAMAETTGFRKSELLNLQWRDIDFELKIAKITAKRASVFEHAGNEYPVLAWHAKSHEERAVPLPDWVLSLLAEYQTHCDESPYVFIDLDRLFVVATEIDDKGRLGPNYELANNLSRNFDLIQRQAREFLAREAGVELAKFPWQRGTLHDLRRTYGTRMARVIPMHVLKEYMGHAKVTTTQEYYLAAQTEDAERARNAMEAMGQSGDADDSPQGRMLDACTPKPASDRVSGRLPKSNKPRVHRGLCKRGGRDSNPQPPDRQSGTLTN